MRYIPLHEQVPGQDSDEVENAKIQAWLIKAETLRQQLESAPDDEVRKKIIDDNHTFWGEIKYWLLKLSDNKCWFSEARDCISHWEVEHFRPKKSTKDINGTEQMGYWWLAFDWNNFRICGNVPNRKKGTFFPLKDGCPRINPMGDVRLEDQMLLDPADPEDPVLIFFNLEGKAIPAPGCCDPWDIKRVNYSIERYSLNDYPPLMNERKKTWNNCWALIQEYLKELQTYQSNGSPIARNSLKEKAKQIRALLQKEVEFSSVARACIESSGHPRVRDLLRNI